MPSSIVILISGEINNEEDKILIAGGSKGGNKYNNFMSKRAFPSQVRLDLKLIADIGLVGLVMVDWTRLEIDSNM